MIPLFSTEQVRKADKYAIEQLGIPGIVLMENASLSIFNEILNNFPELSNFETIGIVAGKGNNAGDGFALARHFVNNGFHVKIVCLADENQLKGDALTNFLILNNLSKSNQSLKIIKFSSIRDLNLLKDCSVIVDALLGTGAKGSLREPYFSIVRKLNSFNSIKVAIDLPTGLDLNNPNTEVAFEADLTVTLAELKTGLFYGAGYKFAGKVVKGSIGIGDYYFETMEINSYLIEPEDAFSGLPSREIDANKYSAGKVFLIAGSVEMPGAAVYSANSALYSGAGAVILAIPEKIRQVAQTKLNSVIAFTFDSQNYLKQSNIKELESKIQWADVIAIGPGLGRQPETLKAVTDIFDKFGGKKFVVDADAIFALSKIGLDKFNFKNTVFTPHYGEFANLLGITTEELKNNLLNAGIDFVKKTSAYLVLKGAPTVVFNPQGEIFINTSGNAGLAKFGSGDVLTGLLSSFIAQTNRMESSIISAVYLHGLDADLLVESKTLLGLNAEDLITNIPQTIKFLEDSFNE